MGKTPPAEAAVPAAGAPAKALKPDLSVGFLTCSFRGDFALCEALCESIDRHVPEEIEHVIIVPKGDLEMFSRFRSSRRTIVPATAFQPPGFITVPPAPQPYRKMFRLPAREVNLSLSALPVRGWLMQQIRKISASAQLPWDAIVHVDSDMCFVRPVEKDHFIKDGKVRFYRDDNPEGQIPFWRWHEAASELLGLPPTKYLGAGYINQLVVWRRSVVTAMIERLKETNRAEWHRVLARNWHLSEYTLYGGFADHAAGDLAEGLFTTDEELCHNCWTDLRTREEEDRFINDFPANHVAYLLQSTSKMPDAQRRDLHRRICEHLGT